MYFLFRIKLFDLSAFIKYKCLSFTLTWIPVYPIECITTLCDFTYLFWNGFINSHNIFLLIESKCYPYQAMRQVRLKFIVIRDS